MGAFSTRHAGSIPTRTPARVVVVALLYWLTAQLGLLVAIDARFTPIWIPAGIALVATMRWGPWMVTGVAVAEFLASLQADIPAPVAASLGLGNALEPLVAVAILRRLGVRDSIRRVRDAFVLLLAIFAGAAVSATVAIAAFLTVDMFTLDDAMREWPLFWSSVVLAVMLVAPFVLALLADQVERERASGRLVEATVVFGLVATTSVYMLDGTHPYASVLLYPLFVWGALRFGVIGASGSILLAACFAISYEIANPDVLPELGLDRAGSVLALQAVLATAAVGNLVLATLLIERDASRVELQRTARGLAEAQEIAHLGSWEWQLRDHEVRASDEFRRMFHVTPDARGLDAILRAVDEEDRPAVERAIGRAIEHGEPFSLEHRIHDGADERIVLHAGRMAGRPRGPRRRLVATVLDVTERTSLDRLRDALIATASHELRTPLTSIVGFADTLITHWDRFDEQRRFEFLRIIGAQGRRLSQVVDDTLMQSRLDAGTLVVARDPYPVANAIRDAIELADVGDDVEVHCDRSLVAIGNQEHLTQIVVNFLTNAVKYGDPPFEVDVREVEHGACLEVRVIDHGPGIDPAFRERLFERFTRGPGTDAKPGTGLGMSIVRGLASANDGRVWYERDGDRTVFTVTVRRWSRAHAPH